MICDLDSCSLTRLWDTSTEQITPPQKQSLKRCSHASCSCFIVCWNTISQVLAYTGQEDYTENSTSGLNLRLTHEMVKHLNYNRWFISKDLVFENRLRTLSQEIPGRAVTGGFQVTQAKVWGITIFKNSHLALRCAWWVSSPWFMEPVGCSAHCQTLSWLYSQLTLRRASSIWHLYALRAGGQGVARLIPVICKGLLEFTVPACGHHPSGCSEPQST